MIPTHSSISDVLDDSSYDATDAVGNLRVTAKYMHAQIADLKLMITALMVQVEALSESVLACASTPNTLDNLRTACQLMAAKVDATATPVTSFVSTFNNNI